ncbi:Yos1-like protein [Pluteus cervinus]|uniref:Yos1-like protein n=1 Tax=Pluteus cervinus TaxID=181527 RepID=A0ACD3BD53_9AGAR|nr:Yos1-like protein [Pluteus cervinus]
MFKFGAIFHASLLFINAVAVLSEDRFLARVGWVSSSTAQRQAIAEGYQQTYDPSGYGNPQMDVSVKAKMIDLITAVRTLMRIPLIVVNILVIGLLLVL